MAGRGAPDTNDKKKALRNAAVFALILLGTLYGVFHGQDMGELKDALAQCRTDWIICAVGAVMVFLLCEAVALRLLLNSFGMGLGEGTCFMTACIGFFFSAITPSSTGGQPMEVYFLRKKGIPVSITSVALLMMAIAYKLILVLIGLGLMLFGNGFLRAHLGGMMFLFYIGMLLTGGWTVFLLLMVFRPGMARGILIWGMSMLEQLHIMKRREEHQASLEVAMDMYADAADHLKKHPRVIVEVLFVMLLRRAALFTVTWFVYRAFGLSGTSWVTIALLQATISICADMLPLPGGMGASEGLFLKVFAPAFGALALPGMVLSRGIGHYAQLILCALVTMLALFLAERGRKIE